MIVMIQECFSNNDFFRDEARGNGTDLKKQKRMLLMVDDDSEDVLLIGEAVREVAPKIDFKSLEDGKELMDYLYLTIGSNGRNPCPELIFLDLNMPKKSGFEALAEMKSNAHLKRIPVIILSTSTVERDINRSFDMGANSFPSKPHSYNELLTLVSLTVDYWFGVSRLPSTFSKAAANL